MTPERPGDGTGENPFHNPKIAAGYEDWYRTEGRWADAREKALLRWLLRRFGEVETILEVGCGTGHFTRWLAQVGLEAAGLDLSRPMLDQAVRLGGQDHFRANALRIPLAAHSFDLIALITTLEFLPNPRQALREALRVARRGLILGVLNAGSRLARQYRRQGGPIWNSARFYTPAELKRLVLETVGDGVEIIWRTTLWPFWPGALPLPWGGFIGMAVRLAGG
jgi:ubiquinone/menaquinone biosynthesis C-methylase UbiE